MSAGSAKAPRKKSQSLPPPIHPINEVEPLDVSSPHTEAKEEGGGKKKEEEGEESAMATLTKAILILPTLIHHATQSHKKHPTDPMGEGKMSYDGDWVHRKEEKVFGYHETLDSLLYNITPWIYITLWSVLVVMYFVTGTFQIAIK